MSFEYLAVVEAAGGGEVADVDDCTTRLPAAKQFDVLLLLFILLLVLVVLVLRQFVFVEIIIGGAIIVLLDDVRLLVVGVLEFVAPFWTVSNWLLEVVAVSIVWLLVLLVVLLLLVACDADV